MDINVNEYVFEPSETKKEVIIPDGFPQDEAEIMSELLASDYYNRGISIPKFLDEDKTIDLEKLELAIVLAIKYLQFSVKIGEPVYVFLREMESYFHIRRVQDDERIIEESSFILGFCRSVAKNYSESAEVLYEQSRDNDGP